MAKNEEDEENVIPVWKLMGEEFIIPHYQRGYRWEKQEVTELLDDLLAFRKDGKPGEFYCLQPIVLQKNDEGKYDVLDGQQRLTTLYLILFYLDKFIKENGYPYKLFFLNYATRKKYEDFLSEKKFSTGEYDSSNIDFHYICKAYQCIDEWFKKHPGEHGKFVNILLDKTGQGNKNVKVIRYEIPQSTGSVEGKINPIDVFIRLNVGKIPLTDAELTKALLLQSDKYQNEDEKYSLEKKEIIKMKLYNIATEWDNIETALHDETFWGLLNDNSNEKSAHIEFIFDLIADKIYKTYFDKKPEKYATFLIFSKHLQDLINNGNDGDGMPRIEAVEKIWDEVMLYFEHFREWFRNRTLYHYIGLITTLKGYSEIKPLIEESEKISKPEFIEHLERKIARIVKTEKPLKDLIFEDEDSKSKDAWAIRKILLLHNVYTTLNSENEKPYFPFFLYKEQEWSLEHIHARKSKTLTDIKKQKEWLYDHIKSLNNLKTDDFKDLISKMEIMMKKDDIAEEDFNSIEKEVYEKIKECFEFENEENVHSIKNLCLLDKDTNSKLNNSVFDVKREKIKKRELEGYYIPICTRNVFLKAYTAFPATNTYWTKVDRDDYFKSIEETYNIFLTKLEGKTI
jgi:hypothetical protein